MEVMSRYQGVNVKSSEQHRNLRFGSAKLNILGLSDTHGRLSEISKLYDNFESNINKIFPEKEKKSTGNVFAIVGDWFMNPAQKGFSFDRTRPAIFYQTIFLNKLIQSMKNKVVNLKTFFTPGNHCLEGGDKFLFDNIKKTDMTTLMSNAHLKTSKIMEGLTPEEAGKIKSFEIVKVPDSKDPGKTHNTLFLGLVVPGIDYYNPGMVKNINIIDRMNKTEIHVDESELKSTYEALNKIVKNFKASPENEKGGVVLLSHSGNRISEMIAKNVEDINVVLNAHDHENKEVLLKRDNGKETKIISLWQNSKKLEAIHMDYSDDGVLEKIESEAFYTKDVEPSKNNPFKLLYKKFFANDMKPYFTVNDPKGRAKLEIDNIRYDDNDVAKIITDGVLASVNKYHKGTEVFGAASSTFRQELSTSLDRPVTNMELMNVNGGMVDSLSEVCVGKLKGKDLAIVILDNLQENLKDKNRNTILQWAGVQLDKGALSKEINEGRITKFTDTSKAKSFIKIKDEHGEYQPIDLNRDYKVAIPRKFFIRTGFEWMKSKESSFENMGRSMDDLLREHIDDSNRVITVPQDKRILT